MVNATTQPLYPRERDFLSIVQEAGWAAGPGLDGCGESCPKLDLNPGPFVPLRDAIPTTLSGPTKKKKDQINFGVTLTLSLYSVLHFLLRTYGLKHNFSRCFV